MVIRQKDSWSGKHLREMFRTGTNLLNNNAPAVNALNVFPVPDGDTGTNMLLTMQSAMAEANLCTDNDASAVAQAMAKGALMGARGNSGVILSQVFRGIAQGLEEKKSFTGMDMAKALVKASRAAYDAMSKPAEGTMLTVIREASEVAQATSYAGYYDLRLIMEAAVKEAKESVIRSPDLLPVLKESGVVDAGGQGLALILEGLLFYLQGKEIEAEDSILERQPSAILAQPREGKPTYGYCTEFLIHGEAIDLNQIRETLSGIGDSLLVVGDETTARVHVHTFDPGAAISYGITVGTLKQIKINNMEDQHREFVAAQSGKTRQYLGKVSAVPVVSGDGLVQVFGSLGATQVIAGGETMNPSVQEMVRAVESVPTDEVIILPNNPDILAAARQVGSLTKKKIVVIPSRTIPQGIAALMAFNPETDLEGNTKSMTESLSTVRTGYIATAVRSMRYRDMTVKKDQVIGFVDEELTVAEYALEDILQKLLQKMRVQDGEIMTVYYGESVGWADTEKLFDPIRSQYPNLEVEVVFGGQPHYAYIISVE
ncbi:MAG: DAK2 domain-containing protein [Dehalococcoidia bacterium]|nr:DAK2 domain-containing protein [Dehalococcoidia bacterium]